MKDLTGKGKPFHSSLDKAAALLKRKVGTGAEFMQELKGLGGIKQAEIDERKLGEVMGMPRMTHDQFMANLSIRPVPAIQEKVLGGDEDDPNWTGPYHGQYTLPGGKNYREMLIKAPQSENNQEKIMDLEAKMRRAPPEKVEHYKSLIAQLKNISNMDAGQFEGVTQHFGGEAGILASLRLKDRIVPGDMGFTIVNKKSGFKGPHFNTQEEALAAMQGYPESLRPNLVLKESQGPNKKYLHLEELQSDWHQQGREKGYRGDQKKIDWDDPEYSAARNRSMELNNEFNRNSHRPDRQAEIEPAMREASALVRSFSDRNNKIGNLVPDAPFKKNWEEMALKRLIHHAAENGYHGIVVTPGEAQADRYSLAKQVDSIAWQKQPDGTFSIQAIKNDDDYNSNEVLSKDKLSGSDLAGLIGKEAASKISENSNQQPMGTLSGLDLQMGGEGMKSFYDKKVPNILNTIGKKYGVKTEKIQVPVKHELQGLRTMGGYKEDPPLDLHHFPITEDMRKDILTNGLPLYNEGGVVHKAEGGAVNAFDYENPEHTQGVAHHLSNHADFKRAVAPDMDIKKILNEMLSKGEHRFVEDPRTQAAIHKAGHSHYYVREKTGKVKYPIQHVVKKAFGGSVNEMRAEMMGRKPVSLNDLTTIGANEAPDMNVKAYVPPSNQEQLPVGGVSTNQGALPIGGVDMNSEQQGHQIGLQGAAPQPPQDGQPTPPQGQPSPLSAGASSPSQQSNILQMTPQGQALNAMKPPQPMPQMAMGGSISSLGGVINNEDEEISPLQKAYQEQLTNDDDGNTNFSVDDTSYLAKGGGVQGYASKGYVTSTPTKPDPVVGTRFKATPQGNLVKRKNLNIENYENKGSIVGIPYDATTRDNLVTEVSGHSLINPLLTEAGFDYSMDPKHVKKGIGGASNLGIASRVQGRIDQAAREHQGDVFLVPQTMSDSEKAKDFPENFSHHPVHILMDLMEQRQLNKDTLQKLTDDLRSQPEIVKDAKTGKPTKVYPYTKFVGFGHPLMKQQLMKGGHGLDTTAGNLRKKMTERLHQVNIQKLLDYNSGDLRAAILDPDIASDPKGYMGRNFIKAKPGAPLTLSSHSAYDTDYGGKYAGGFGANRPIEIIQPDVYETIDKEIRERPVKKAKNEAEYRAQVIGAIEKRKERIAQPINARVINNAGLYEEGLKQGEFDPKNLESVLAYYKRKGGYKKGGKVSDNLDTMRLALTKKKAK